MRNIRILAFLTLMTGVLGTLYAGSLLDKAIKFDSLIATEHIPLGLVVNLTPIGATERRFSSTADSTIWTGAYIASQIYRYKVTGDSVAIDNAEKGLRAFVTLHKMSGSQGFVGRCFGPPDEFAGRNGMSPGIGSYSHLVFRADTSRDQYTGIFLGCAAAWLFIRDEELKKDISELVEQAGLNLVRNNLALKARIGEVTITPFNLNPDYAYQDRITPEEWAKVDDFPANVFAQAVPYSERLAKVVAGFHPPPIRGGEALRALMMLETAANISNNGEIRDFLEKELLVNRRLAKTASETCLMLSDVIYGRNAEIVEQKMAGVLAALAKVFYHGVNIKTGIPESVTLMLEPVAMVFLNHLAVESSRKILDILAYFRQPQGFGILLLGADRIEALTKQLEWMKIKTGKSGEKIKNLIARLREFGHSNVDQFADTMRSYVGCNITFLALLGILENGRNPEIMAAAKDILPRDFANIADETNSFYSFIAAVFSPVKLEKGITEAAIETLRLYPENQEEKRFDHSKDENLTVSPWPDRFGRIGGQSIELIPINQRAPHIFIWQEPPRNLCTGSDSGRKIAPVGYLLAYWFGRYHNLLNEKD